MLTDALKEAVRLVMAHLHPWEPRATKEGRVIQTLGGQIQLIVKGDTIPEKGMVWEVDVKTSTVTIYNVDEPVEFKLVPKSL